MQHKNRGHARVREVGIEKLVAARGMTRDGASSPITAFSSLLYFVLHPVFLVSPQPRFPHFHILRKSHSTLQNNGNRTHRTANLVSNHHHRPACTASLSLLCSALLLQSPRQRSVDFVLFMSFYFFSFRSVWIFFFFHVVPSNTCLPW